MVVADIMQRQPGLLLPWGGPPLGPGIQNGVPPFFPPLMMNPMQIPQIPSHPPGLIPQAHDYSASPLVSTHSPSVSRRSSVDLKGKGKAASYDARHSSGSFMPVGSSASAEKIFTSGSGEPLTFYVAIDVNKRTDILNHIRRNGGQISTQTTADFAILSFRSKDFETLLETVLSSNGTAVKPAFVLDSVEQNTLADSSQYEYEVPPKLLRKVQKSAAPRSPAKTDAEKRQAANLRRTKSRQAKKEAAAAAVAVKEERVSPGLSRPHIPSPSPPPEHTRVLWNRDKYRYPEVEDQYVRTYCQVLFARDREMSYATIAAKLHAKMPHHTIKGWNNRISQTLREDVEQVRKRAIIAYRKEQHQLESQQSNVEEEPPAKRKKLSPSADAGQQSVAVADDDVEQDLNVVAHFFANGGDEQPEGDQDQSRVWQKLTEKTPCRTEPSWEVFYNKYHERVMELFEMLVGAQDASGNTAE